MQPFLFIYIKSHFKKNHIAADPEDWVWHTVNGVRISSMMFLDGAEIRNGHGTKAA